MAKSSLSRQRRLVVPENPLLILESLPRTAKPPAAKVTLLARPEHQSSMATRPQQLRDVAIHFAAIQAD